MAGGHRHSSWRLEATGSSGLSRATSSTRPRSTSSSAGRILHYPPVAGADFDGGITWHAAQHVQGMAASSTSSSSGEPVLWMASNVHHTVSPARPVHSWSEAKVSEYRVGIPPASSNSLSLPTVAGVSVQQPTVAPLSGGCGEIANRLGTVKRGPTFALMRRPKTPPCKESWHPPGSWRRISANVHLQHSNSTPPSWCDLFNLGVHLAGPRRGLRR